MDMRKYISDRLGSMKSTAEKDMLRDVMENIFIPLYDHVEDQYARLETRVRDEFPFITDPYVVWGTLMERERANGGCPYLFPMLDDDLLAPEIEMADLAQRLKAEREIRLDTVFAQADHFVCKEIEDKREILEGTLSSEDGEFKIGVRLQLSKRYSACVQRLYKLFLSNCIPWQTLNIPYTFKMFDVMLVRIDMADKEVEGVANGYRVTYGEHERYVKRGLIPVWNVCKLRIQSEDFPLAALDKVNYEYVFDLEQEGAEHGYLADWDSADISAVRREENTLIVTSPEQKSLAWDMYKIVRRKDYATVYFDHEIVSNAQADSFAARMIAHYGTVIKTSAELRRMLEGYEASKYLSFESAQIVWGEIPGESYEVNSFLKDEVRDVAVSKSLLLRFKPLKCEPYLLRDLMSFLVSQVQLVYPEFHCVGVLV